MTQCGGVALCGSRHHHREGQGLMYKNVLSDNRTRTINKNIEFQFDVTLL